MSRKPSGKSKRRGRASPRGEGSAVSDAPAEGLEGEEPSNEDDRGQAGEGASHHEAPRDASAAVSDPAGSEVDAPSSAPDERAGRSDDGDADDHAIHERGFPAGTSGPGGFPSGASGAGASRGSRAGGDARELARAARGTASPRKRGRAAAEEAALPPGRLEANEPIVDEVPPADGEGTDFGDDAGEDGEDGDDGDVHSRGDLTGDPADDSDELGPDGEAGEGGEAGESDDEEGTAASFPTSANQLNDAQLTGLVEALIFASDKPLPLTRLRQLTRVSDIKRLQRALEQLVQSYQGRGIALTSVSGGYQLRTESLYSAWVQQLIAGRPVRLSRAQLETLAIIAYRQPITRPEIDEIRGVDSTGTLKMLMDRNLVRILGKREEVGRPMLYGTTKEFLDFFSLGDLRELPTLREYSELSPESRAVVSKLGFDDPAAPPPTGAAPSADRDPVAASSSSSAGASPFSDEEGEDALAEDEPGSETTSRRSARLETESDSDLESDPDSDLEPDPDFRAKRRLDTESDERIESSTEGSAEGSDDGLSEDVTGEYAEVARAVTSLDPAAAMGGLSPPDDLEDDLLDDLEGDLPDDLEADELLPSEPESVIAEPLGDLELIDEELGIAAEAEPLGASEDPTGEWFGDGETTPAVVPPRADVITDDGVVTAEAETSDTASHQAAGHIVAPTEADGADEPAAPLSDPRAPADDEASNE